MKDYVIETRQVTKTFGSLAALSQVSLHVKRGEIYGLIGDNGAGKTTLLKLLTGQIWPDQGEICLLGRREEKQLERERKKLGAIVGDPGIFPYLSVEKNMEYYRLLKGVPGKEQVEKTLRLVGMWERRKKKGRELSMGMKQRLSLAIAMIGEPQILILDEPINGLDPSGTVEFRTLLKHLNQEKNITILLSSHILPELQQTATTFGFLDQGILLEEIKGEKLQERCTDYLEITVSDPEAYAVVLEQVMPEEYCKVMPDRRIRIMNPQKQAEEYSRLALESRILITGLERHRCSLEDYYMQLKGGKKHA